MLCQWNNINLKDLFRSNSEKNKNTIFNNMILQLRQIQRGLNYEFQSDTALRNKIIMFYSNIFAYNVTILQQTIIITELINNIYVIIENNKEIIKTEKFESFDFETYFIDRKYYINRSLNFIYNKSFASSSLFNNDFQKKNALSVIR